MEMAPNSSEWICRLIMRIGIDISQIVYEGTGVARYVRKLVLSLVTLDQTNEYVLFGSSLRQRNKFYNFYKEIIQINKKTTLKAWWIPPMLLDILWNQMHIFPIEWFLGDIDIFWSSDWTQPPLNHAKGITTIHDLSFFHFPESFHKTILSVQKRRLKQAKKECQSFLCDSQATKHDVQQLLHIEENKLHVIYPGFTL